MADKQLDLKNPGGKEAIVVGGGALLLALIYFALHKSKPAAAAAPATGTGPGGTGPGGAPGASVPGFLLPGDTSGMASSFTGNAFTDAIATADETGTSGSPGFLHGPTGVGVHLPGVSSHSETGLNVLNAGSSGGPPVAGGPAPTGTSGGGYVTYAQIFQALVAKGVSAAGAAGILGNIQNESSGQVENTTGDSGQSWGLVQWNLPSHPYARGFVTGNLQHDFANQINSIVQTFKTGGFSGSAGQIGGQWAAQFENCVGCQPGQGQWTQRVANANAFYQQYLKGAFNPPKPKPKPVPGITPGMPWIKGNPFYKPGTKPATAAKIRSLFPIMKLKPKAPPKPKPRKPAVRKRPAPGTFGHGR